MSSLFHHRVTKTERLPLEAVDHPLLLGALKSWLEITGAEHAYQYADVVPLLHKDGIFLPSSTFILVEGKDVRNYIMAYFGPGFGIFDGVNLTGRAVGDFPDPSYIDAIEPAWTDVVESGEIAYHRVRTYLDNKRIDYLRLIMPCTEKDGRVTAFVTTSVSRQYPYLAEDAPSAEIIPFPSRDTSPNA